jgi:hypothetical protein
VWWVVFVDDKGNPRLRGPYVSEVLARRKLDNLLMKGNVYELPTSSSERATRMLKEKRIDEFGYQEGVKRFSHK